MDRKQALQAGSPTHSEISSLASDLNEFDITATQHVSLKKTRRVSRRVSSINSLNRDNIQEFDVPHENISNSKTDEKLDSSDSEFSVSRTNESATDSSINSCSTSVSEQLSRMLDTDERSIESEGDQVDIKFDQTENPIDFNLEQEECGECSKNTRDNSLVTPDTGETSNEEICIETKSSLAENLDNDINESNPSLSESLTSSGEDASDTSDMSDFQTNDEDYQIETKPNPVESPDIDTNDSMSDSQANDQEDQVETKSSPAQGSSHVIQERDPSSSESSASASSEDSSSALAACKSSNDRAKSSYSLLEDSELDSDLYNACNESSICERFTSNNKDSVSSSNNCESPTENQKVDNKSSPNHGDDQHYVENTPDESSLSVKENLAISPVTPNKCDMKQLTMKSSISAGERSAPATPKQVRIEDSAGVDNKKAQQKTPFRRSRKVIDTPVRRSARLAAKKKPQLFKDGDETSTPTFFFD